MPLLLGGPLLQMLRLLVVSGVLFLPARTGECSSAPLGTDTTVSVDGRVSQRVLRPPRSSSPALADIVGLEEAKAVLHEAIILPSSLPVNAGRLFWRSSERTAILLVGPSGLGKGMAVEAVASAAGAQVLPLLATEVAASGFCNAATAAVIASGRPVVVVIDNLEMAPDAALSVRQCLRELTVSGDEVASRIFIVATLARELQPVDSVTLLAPFGYVARLAVPSDAERKVFIERLFAQISRVDAHWGSALREAAVVTLANLTAMYTFAEIDLVVRRAFIRSTNDEGVRDPVALHHFEKILAEAPPRAAAAFQEAFVYPSPAVVVASEPKKGSSDNVKPKSKDAKDPMDGIFGWCNFFLPEALHIPAVVWAMIIFGVLAHFMARWTQPYGQKKRRGGAAGGSGARSSLFGDVGGGGGGAGGAAGFPAFGEGMNDWSSFANLPPPPSMGRGGADLPDSFLSGALGSRGVGVAGDAAAAAVASDASRPTPSVSSTAAPQ